MMPQGDLTSSQWEMRLHGRLGRHTYEGLALGTAEQQGLVENLGMLDGLVLENHGTMTVGRTVAEAFMMMHLLECAAKAQVRAMAASVGQIEVVSAACTERTYHQRIGDGCEWVVDVEWPALLLRHVERMSPGFGD